MNWSVRWETTRSGFQRYEVFTDPAGVEWVRARSDDATELVLPLKTPGLPALRLKRRSRPMPAAARAGLEAAALVRRDDSEDPQDLIDALAARVRELEGDMVRILAKPTLEGARRIASRALATQREGP